MRKRSFPGNEDIGQAHAPQLLDQFWYLLFLEGVDDGKALAFAWICYCGHGEDALGDLCGFVECLLDPTMGHHLTADLGKPRKAIRDFQESVLADQCHVTGDVPTVAQGFPGEIFSAQISDHDVGPL